MSSIKSKSKKSTYIFQKRDGKGDFRCFGDGFKVPDLSADNWNFDNQATSSAVKAKDVPLCI